MNNFTYITVEKFIKQHPDEKKNYKRLKEIAAQPDVLCQCEQQNVWKYGESGLCFSCTTGEADASDDYELE